MVTLSGNFSAHWVWHDLERAICDDSYCDGEKRLLQECLQPLPSPLPRKEETYPLIFFPSLLSREGLALPDCVFHAFVLLIRRKVVRSRRRKDVWLELEEDFVRSEFWKGEVQD